MAEEIQCSGCENRLGYVVDGKLVCRTCLDKQRREAMQEATAYYLMSREFAMALNQAVAEGVDFLSWEQPRGAMIDNLGVVKWLKRYTPDVDPHEGVLFNVRVCPTTASTATLIFDTNFYYRLIPRDVDRFKRAVKRVADIIDQWNGVGHESFSVRIKRRGSKSWAPAVKAASVYSKGCPRHKGSVFCSRDGCTWQKRHASKLKVPEGWY